VEVRASSRRPRTQTGTDNAIGRIAAAHAQREERQKKKKQEEEKAERSRKKRQQQDEEDEEEEEEEDEESGGLLYEVCCMCSVVQNIVGLAAGEVAASGHEGKAGGRGSRGAGRVVYLPPFLLCTAPVLLCDCLHAG
jgi:hypothetical protein